MKEENNILDLIDDGEDCGSHGVMFDVDITKVVLALNSVAFFVAIALSYSGFESWAQWIMPVSLVASLIVLTPKILIPISKDTEIPLEYEKESRLKGHLLRLCVDENTRNVVKSMSNDEIDMLRGSKFIDDIYSAHVGK